MRDVVGYQAYRRLRRGWKLLSLSLIGVASSPLLLAHHGSEDVGQACLIASLACGLWGGLLAASGSLAGWFRKNCLLVALNFAVLLVVQGSTSWLWGLPWLSLLSGLWVADRSLRTELGLSRRTGWIPPGCLLGLILLPFLWPLAVFLSTVCLCIYLVAAYCYTSGALPGADELAVQLDQCGGQAVEAITRI